VIAPATLAQHPAARDAHPVPVPAAPALDPKVARRITIDELRKRIDAGEKPIIVDARSGFTGPMIKGAVRVPGDKLEAWAKTVSKDAFIVTYCTCPAEHTAANHVIQLQKYGFTNAYALLGGLSAWQNALLPVEAAPPADQSREP
jgi:rhodanese-related sulfurtransferase